jgi:hypothetical protein
VYVETLIRADLEVLWLRTQEPQHHQRWDARFTWIDYVPGTDAAGQQHFRYATRVPFGPVVSGTGVCVGERLRADGARTSALRFASTDPLSLIRSGSGYWRYVPTPSGVLFLTGYDYLPGWGRWGRAADRVFRPLIGWGTAWSFDRLRLWLERGISPEAAFRRAAAEVAARVGISVAAFVLVPPLVAASVAAACVLVPPLPSTPAARRCLRRPPRSSR